MTSVDAFLLWLRNTVVRAGNLAKQLTRSEAVLAATLTACTIVAGIAAVRDPGPRVLAILGAAALVAVVLAPAVIVDAVITRDNLQRAHGAIVRTNAAKPTGAPRVAEVRCVHGDVHRFVYGPGGWSAAGPGADIPEHEEATAP